MTPQKEPDATHRWFARSSPNGDGRRRFEQLTILTSVLLVALLTAHLLGATALVETEARWRPDSSIEPSAVTGRFATSAPPHVRGLSPAAVDPFSARFEGIGSADSSVVEATAPERGFRVRFAWEGPDLTGAGSSGARVAGIRFETADIDGKALPIEMTTLVAGDEWMEYHRGPLVEWYAARNDRIIQGFTLLQGPPGQALRIATTLIGDPEVLADEGHSSADSSGIQAHDASGAALDVSLETAPSRLILHVDASDADYPVILGPVKYRARVRSERSAAALPQERR